METLKPNEIMYSVFSRLLNSAEWHQQETTESLHNAEYWLERNQKRDSNREFKLVKKTTTFEVMA